MRNRVYVLAVVSLVALMGFSISFADSCHTDDTNVQAATPTKAEKTKAIEVGNMVCPVMGEKINPDYKATYEYEGKIYNFCWPGCLDEFKKDPAKYIKKVEEEMQKAGEKVPDPNVYQEHGHAH